MKLDSLMLSFQILNISTKETVYVYLMLRQKFKENILNYRWQMKEKYKEPEEMSRMLMKDSTSQTRAGYPLIEFHECMTKISEYLLKYRSINIQYQYFLNDSEVLLNRR